MRAIVQHVSHRFNTELYTDGRQEEQRDLFTQLLFSYKLNPQTVVFLGYGDSRALSEDGGLPPAARQLFLKVSYAFQG